MEVPEHVLERVKCTRCKGLLACAPVYLCPDGTGLCNACFSDKPDLTATRNTHYEAVAELLLFPCKHQGEGCKVKSPFNNLDDHEECSHRKYPCPLEDSSACEWLGSFERFLEHCQDQHPGKVLDNPAELTHDFTKSNSHVYLLLAFDLLFLLFTKVCVTSGKIYYSVRYIGSSSEVQNFKYNLTVTREDETVTKKGQVVPHGYLPIHEEDSSLIININYLLGILGGFNNTKFTVTMQQILVGEKCSICGTLLKVKEYRDCNGWKCIYCAPNKRICGQYIRRVGSYCKYKTFPEKLIKHQFYCDSNQCCPLCETSFNRDLLQHYNKDHRNYTNGSAWRVVEKANDYFLNSSDAGTAVCKYSWTTSHFDLSVHIPVSNEQLSNFHCKVKVTQLATGHIRTFTPKISYDKGYDWLAKVTNDDFNGWSDSFEISVSICKIK